MLRSMSRPAWILVVALACGLATAWSAPAMAQSQPPQPQDGFVAVGDAPVQEQIPAAPLLIGAYMVVLGGLFVYVVSLAKRLTAVQRDVDRLERDLARRGSGRP